MGKPQGEVPVISEQVDDLSTEEHCFLSLRGPLSCCTAAYTAETFTEDTVELRTMYMYVHRNLLRLRPIHKHSVPTNCE